MIDHLAQSLSDTDMEEDPPIGSHEPGHDHDHDRCEEQWFERRPERSRDTLGHDTDPISEGQEWVGSGERRAGPVGCGENTLGPQFLIDQELHVVAGQIALDPLAHDGCDFLRVAVAIGGLDNLVEQWWQLKDLAIRSTHHRGWFLEARALVGAESLDTSTEGRRPLAAPCRGHAIPLIGDHHRLFLMRVTDPSIANVTPRNYPTGLRPKTLNESATPRGKAFASQPLWAFVKAVVLIERQPQLMKEDSCRNSVR